MKKIKTYVIHKKKKIELFVHDCNFIEKGTGLMFSRKEKAKILQFKFNSLTNLGIHSYFVFYDFLAIWVDEKNNVVQIDFVKPWTKFLRPKKMYKRLIEIPINSKNNKLVKKFGY